MMVPSLTQNFLSTMNRTQDSVDGKYEFMPIGIRILNWCTKRTVLAWIHDDHVVKYFLSTINRTQDSVDWKYKFMPIGIRILNWCTKRTVSAWIDDDRVESCVHKTWWCHLCHNILLSVRTIGTKDGPSDDKSRDDGLPSLHTIKNGITILG